jgi:tRNA threonylcarbamoyladenosine biosynthesis protein TsaB
VNVLGIDTSTAASAVCVLRTDGEAFEVQPEVAALTGAPFHSSELMPAVFACLERSGLGYSEIDVIAVGIGPGAFTGLRIGVATARALSHASGAEVRPVSSLAALAAGIDAPVRLPLIDARRGELFAALYEGDRRRLEPFAAAPEEVVERVRKTGLNPLAAGDGALRFPHVLEAAGARIAAAGSPAHVVRGLSICRAAADSPATPPEGVLPHYLRLPDATPQVPN